MIENMVVTAAGDWAIEERAENAAPFYRGIMIAAVLSLPMWALLVRLVLN